MSERRFSVLYWDRWESESEKGTRLMGLGVSSLGFVVTGGAGRNSGYQGLKRGNLGCHAGNPKSKRVCEGEHLRV